MLIERNRRRPILKRARSEWRTASDFSGDDEMFLFCGERKEREKGRGEREEGAARTKGNGAGAMN